MSYGVMLDYVSRFLICADHYSSLSLPRLGHVLFQGKYTKYSVFEVNISLFLLIVGYSHSEKTVD